MERFVKKLLALSPVQSAWFRLYSSRCARATHPSGNFDTAGRWYPDECERVYGSFDDIRRPTRSYPYSYMLRARTKAHCKLLVLAYLFKEFPGYVPPADVNTTCGGRGLANLIVFTDAVADVVLPKKWRIDSAGRTLAIAALRAYVNRDDAETWDWHAAGVLADWLADRGEAKAADAIRAELPAVAFA